MEDILTLYAKPYNPREPVICIDEKSRQLACDTRPLKHTKEHKPRRRDHEYVRNGTRNLFVTVEPKGGYRTIAVTPRRTRKDFAREMQRIVDLPRYQDIDILHVVLDNLNTHFEKSFYETFPKGEADRILAKVRFHYTPKHASWLDMAEIEIGILDKCYLGVRVPDEKALVSRTASCMQERNEARETIDWTFTVRDARKKFTYGGAKLN